jgi:hypothetical protein
MKMPGSIPLNLLLRGKTPNMFDRVQLFLTVPSSPSRAFKKPPRRGDECAEKIARHVVFSGDSRKTIALCFAL